jgi:hypothetical protein
MKAQRGIFKFFFYINQNLFLVFLYRVIDVFLVNVYYKEDVWAHLVFNIFNIIVSLSYLALYNGIRESVKEALKAYIKVERVRSSTVKSSFVESIKE